MAHYGLPARPAVCWVNRVLFGSVLALLIASLVSWLGFDWQAISALSSSQVHWDGSFWVAVFTRLGKAWLLIWLLLSWFLVSHRRRDVLTGLLALVIVGVLVNPLKVAVGRTRPYAALYFQATGQRDDHRTHHLSFPSGDTAVAFGAATAMVPAVGWPLRVLFLGSSTAIGVLRVTCMAHYPSDVLAGAAIGLLAGWLAIRLIDRWRRADQALPFESWLVIGGIIGIPAIQCVSETPSELLVLLGTYGLLVPCIALAMKTDAAMRSGGLDQVLGLLARTRVVAVFLAFAVVITDNVLDREKPHELLPLDGSVFPTALVGFALVFAGAMLRFWAQSVGTQRQVLAEGPYAVVRQPLHLGSLVVVCGLLLQFRDWTNWLVVLPVFVLFYGASLVHEEKVSQARLGAQWQSYKASIPAIVPSLRSLCSLRRFSSWNRTIRADAAAIGNTLALICLPVVIELLIEDFLFERVLGM